MVLVEIHSTEQEVHCPIIQVVVQVQNLCSAILSGPVCGPIEVREEQVVCHIGRDVEKQKQAWAKKQVPKEDTSYCRQQSESVFELDDSFNVWFLPPSSHVEVVQTLEQAFLHTFGKFPEGLITGRVRIELWIVGIFVMNQMGELPAKPAVDLMCSTDFSDEVIDPFGSSTVMSGVVNPNG